MKTIWKFTIEPDTPILMPKGAVLLSVGVQGSIAVLWALVDPSQHKIKRMVMAFPTGDRMLANPGEFVGTFTIEGMVFHVFDGGELYLKS